MIDLLLSPTVALIVLLAFVYAALFHLWKGRTLGDLLLALLMALIGLTLGQLAGRVLGLNVLRMGQAYLLEGTALAWALMLAAAWLKG
ncbi:MAG: hypothetical protein GXP42_16050 [Chloroflexi bacterium]|nr:hypothetical protein [Chloroflexota bacterium]